MIVRIIQKPKTTRVVFTCLTGTYELKFNKIHYPLLNTFFKTQSLKHLPINELSERMLPYSKMEGERGIENGLDLLNHLRCRKI